MPSREEPAPEARVGKGERDLVEDSDIREAVGGGALEVDEEGRDLAIDREDSQLAGDTRCQPTESEGT